MERALETLSTEEFEKLIERTIDRRLEVWLTQLTDALVGSQTTDEDNLERFIGMWADFTPEEDRVFQTILEERASYFAGREIELGKTERALEALSTQEFEELVERTIDRRLEVWLTQLTDALTGSQTTDEDNLERFIGMWADFTPEEDRVFQTILEERASYFAGREIELGKTERALEALSTQEFEELVERTIDKRLEVWLTQLMDAFIGWQEEGTELRPEFAASLRHSLEQARSGKGIDLKTSREQVGR